MFIKLIILMFPDKHGTDNKSGWSARPVADFADLLFLPQFIIKTRNCCIAVLDFAVLKTWEICSGLNVILRRNTENPEMWN
jgi:hypothetical protein